jgi:hypothetical protein
MPRSRPMLLLAPKEPRECLNRELFSYCMSRMMIYA